MIRTSYKKDNKRVSVTNAIMAAAFEKSGWVKVEKVEEDKADSPFDGMTIDELKAYAVEKNINIGNATSQAGIIKKIQEAEK